MGEQRGLIYGESFEQYAKRAGMTATVLKAGRISMKHMRHQAIHGKDETAALAFGKIAHRAVLENGLADGSFAVWEGGRRAGKSWEAYEASATADGKVVITASERDELVALVSAVHSNPLAHQIIEETKHEVSCVWDEPGFGTAKCRFDGISADWYLEWKSTSKKTPREFENQAFSLGYHVGGAHYMAGAMAHGVVPKLRIISTESSAPFDTVVYQLDDSLLEIGQAEREKVWRAYMNAEKSGVYPGHGAQLRILSAPTWAMEQSEQLLAANLETGTLD